MASRSEIEQRLVRSADALVCAVRKQIDRWLHEGVSLREILNRLSAFRLPVREQAKLERAVKGIMEEIVKVRSLALPSEHIDALIAAGNINVGGIQQQMQADLQSEVRRALVAGYGPDVLRKRLEGRGFSNVQTEARTAIRRFNNLLTIENAAVTGTRYFKYFRPVSTVTRPFCRAHAGEVFTLDEIERMNNGQGLSVRESLGGFNCRHYWLAVPDGRPETGDRQQVQIGKQTFLMNDEQKQALFSRERSLWIQTPEATAGKDAAWHMAAKALARAHDGFNEQITNTPSRGTWASYRLGLNFESHADKAIKDGVVTSRSEYALRLTEIVRNPDAEVYHFHGKSGEERLAIFNPHSTWMLMIDRDGKAHTGLRLGRDALRYWKNKTRLGRASKYIGRFK